MQFRLLLFWAFISFFNITKADNAPSFLRPEEFGAVADGVHDDTKAIQMALDSISNLGGGVVQLSRGVYHVSSLKLGIKTSLVGVGAGVTIVKQNKNARQDCVIVSSYSAALQIKDMTIVGENHNRGIYIENSRGNGENHHYVRQLFNKQDVGQPYKWILIDNICVYNFDSGLYVEYAGFDINITNSTFVWNGDGVVMACTDSAISNCYTANNRRNGLTLIGSNNKVSDVKSIFNGRDNASEYAAVVVQGSRNQLTNVETQDNYCKGFLVSGYNNILLSCISNTDGYTSEPKHYDPKTEACGFKITGERNIFSACMVTTYNVNYGALYVKPVILADGLEVDYPNIKNDIQILPPSNRVFSNVNGMESSSNSLLINDRNKAGIIIPVDNSINMDNLHFCLDFMLGDAMPSELLSFENGNTNLNVNLRQNRDGVSFLLYNEKSSGVELNIKELYATIKAKALRLIGDIYKSGSGKTYAQLRMYVPNQKGEWYRISSRKEIMWQIGGIQFEKIKVGNGAIGASFMRIAVTNSPIQESYVYPDSFIQGISSDALLYKEW